MIRFEKFRLHVNVAFMKKARPSQEIAGLISADRGHRQTAWNNRIQASNFLKSLERNLVCGILVFAYFLLWLDSRLSVAHDTRRPRLPLQILANVDDLKLETPLPRFAVLLVPRLSTRKPRRGWDRTAWRPYGRDHRPTVEQWSISLQWLRGHERPSLRSARLAFQPKLRYTLTSNVKHLLITFNN